MAEPVRLSELRPGRARDGDVPGEGCAVRACPGWISHLGACLAVGKIEQAESCRPCGAEAPSRPTRTRVRWLVPLTWCPFSTAAKTMTKVMDTWTTVREKETWERAVPERERWMMTGVLSCRVCFLYMSCEGGELLLAAWRYMLIFSNRKGFTTRGYIFCASCACCAFPCVCMYTGEHWNMTCFHGD